VLCILALLLSGGRTLAREDSPNLAGENFTIDGLVGEQPVAGDIYAPRDAQIQVTGSHISLLWRSSSAGDLGIRRHASQRPGALAGIAAAFHEGDDRARIPMALVERPCTRMDGCDSQTACDMVATKMLKGTGSLCRHPASFGNSGGKYGCAGGVAKRKGNDAVIMFSMER